jgi:hypothetical protein
MRIISTTHHHPLGSAIGAPEGLTERLVSSTSYRLKSSPVKKPFLPPEPLGWPFIPRPWDGLRSK